MVQLALIPKLFLDCVVAIGVLDAKKNEYVWIASGFFYGEYVSTNKDLTKNYRAYLVTNKHVFKDLSTAFLRCNPEADKQAREFALELLNDKQEPLWIGHPKRDIDIAVLPVNFQMLKEQGMQVHLFASDDHVANLTKISQLGITEGDFVYVLGFPMGLIGGTRNAVIVRSGSIARIRDALTKANMEFLIDSFVFPGNSGGPVVSKPDALAIRGTLSQNAAYLIGIVTGYVPYHDVAISQQTQKPRVIFEENSGLAAVHPVDYVQETIAEHLKIKPEFMTEEGPDTPKIV